MKEWYLPVIQVDFVSQHHHGVGLLHRDDLGQNVTPPDIQGFKGFQVCDIESQETAIGAFVEGGHYRAEPLLPACVPDLEGKKGHQGLG